MTPDTLASAGAGEPGAASGKDTPMWAATVTNKQIDKRGNLVVTVEFTDGVKTITEDFATSQEQPSGWLEEQVGRKMKALDGIAATVVPEVGTATEILSAILLFCPSCNGFCYLSPIRTCLRWRCCSTTRSTI